MQYKPLKRHQKGGNTAESTAVRKPVIPPVMQRTSPSEKDRLSALPSDYQFPDGRPWGDPSRVKERMNQFEKATSIAQLAPIPLIKYPAMVLNSALGGVDLYNDLQKGDLDNAQMDLISALPIPDGAAIKSLAQGSKAASKLYRSSKAADVANYVGIGTDVTKKQYQQGGTQSVMKKIPADLTGTKTAFHPDMYKAWGSPEQAFEEGWMPKVSQQGKTIYQNRIPIYNNVEIPGAAGKGHFEVSAGDNGSFDIYTADSTGKMLGDYIQKGGNLQQTRKYFNSPGSPMQDRAKMIMDGTGPNGGTYGYDQPYAILQEGGYVPIQYKQGKMSGKNKASKKRY